MKISASFTSTLAIIFGLLVPVFGEAKSPGEDQASIVAEAREIVDAYYEPGWFSGI